MALFSPREEKEEPCPDVPAVFGFSHVVGTFPPPTVQDIIDVREGRGRPAGRQLVLTNINSDDTLEILRGEVLSDMIVQ